MVTSFGAPPHPPDVYVVLNGILPDQGTMRSSPFDLDYTLKNINALRLANQAYPWYNYKKYAPVLTNLHKDLQSPEYQTFVE